MAGLTPKQELFVKEYLIDLNATQAAIRAGYSKKTANEQGARLLAHVSVGAAIQEAMDKRSKRIEVNSDYVLNTIVETIERCKQEIEPIYEGTGENRAFTGEFRFDSGAVLKGAELLGKHLKLFTDKIEVTGELSLAEAISKAKARVQ
jgi:phage terminase small subunit